MLRARDVREQCKGKVDPVVLRCLEAMAEQNMLLFQMLQECGQCIDQMSNIIAANVQTQIMQEKLITKLDKMRGIDKEQDTRYEDVTE